jgi:hypothetical protein
MADLLSPAQISDYCREIESYLCRKNDGHLIRVVGPSFDLVSGWAADGVPFKIACAGIDRYFERYYRKGARRRPVRIDFCDADVRDVFDEWRRSLGLVAAVPAAAGGTDRDGEPAKPRGVSLPAHLERVVLRLTNARATGALPPAADGILDRLAGELDRSRASAQGLRGSARRALLERLAEIETQLLEVVHAGLTPDERQALEREADDELTGFQAGMAPDVHRRARQAAFERLLRDRFRLPTIAFPE